MEKDIKLQDCTLRDGGYLVDTQFGDKFIKGFIQSLTDAAVDVIEVGFLKDEPHQPGSTIFNNSAQIKPYLPKERREGVAYVALSDYSRYHIENLDPCDGTSITGVRACFFKKERKDVLPFCRRIQELGYDLYIQPVEIQRNGFTMATVGGLVTDGEQNVLNGAYERIEGLYATGNCCGRRFGAQYSTPISGISIGIALTLGREVGRTVAAKKV